MAARASAPSSPPNGRRRRGSWFRSDLGAPRGARAVGRRDRPGEDRPARPGRLAPRASAAPSTRRRDASPAPFGPGAAATPAAPRARLAPLAATTAPRALEAPMLRLSAGTCFAVLRPEDRAAAQSRRAVRRDAEDPQAHLRPRAGGGARRGCRAVSARRRADSTAIAEPDGEAVDRHGGGVEAVARGKDRAARRIARTGVLVALDALSVWRGWRGARTSRG